MDYDNHTFRPILRTQADLEAAWRHLVGPSGHERRSLWLMIIEDDGRPVPHLSEFAELDELPDPGFVSALADVLREVLTGEELRELFGVGCRLAFLVSRPGHDGVRREDRAWAAVAMDLARGLGLPCEVVHLATDGGVTPVPLDELGVA